MVFGVVLGRKDSAILPAQVANHSARFGLPTHGASHNDGTIYCSNTGNFEEHINKGDQPWLIDFCVPEGGENLT